MPKLTYLGHDAFVIETSQHKIAIDPFITGNPLVDISPDELEVDYVLITHGHGDHLGDGLEIAKRCGATVISTFELATYCQKNGAKSHPMHIGGSHEFEFGKVKLTIAHHGNSMESDNGLVSFGPPCGLLVTADARTLYHAGDTGLFLDMKLIGEMNSVDVALLPIGDNFTMGIDDAVKAAEFIDAQLSIPMHYNTFDLIKADPNQFVSRVQECGGKAQVMNIGETITY